MDATTTAITNAGDTKLTEHIGITKALRFGPLKPNQKQTKHSSHTNGCITVHTKHATHDYIPVEDEMEISSFF